MKRVSHINEKALSGELYSKYESKNRVCLNETYIWQLKHRKIMLCKVEQSHGKNTDTTFFKMTIYIYVC